MIYERIYQKLQKMLDLENFMRGEKDYMKLKSGAYMDLNIDKLGTDRIAMAHNFIQNGDVMADPDMEIRIDIKNKTAEALTYQLDSLGVFQVVYPEPGKINVRAKKELNSFLLQWLKNLEHQGVNYQEV